MSLRVKNIVYTLVLLTAVFVVWWFRQNNTKQLVSFSGKTMGPIVYNIKYFDEENRILKPQVDSLLQVFNQSLNTYLPDSEISQFNRDSVFNFDLPYFKSALESAQAIYADTDGAFDPGIGPLINAWGFGPDKSMKPDSTYIDSLRLFASFSNVQFDDKKVWKTDPRVEISFSASAKGYGVDVVTEYLQRQGISDLFVEIGGEVRAIGKNQLLGTPWKVGILDPNSDEINPYAAAIVNLEDRAMATSGNYFNYHVIDGIKYGHTISPHTGYPIQHTLLSASVFASDCMSADALATAFMVMPLKKTRAFLDEHPEYDAYLMFSTDNGSISTFATEGIISSIKPAK